MMIAYRSSVYLIFFLGLLVRNGVVDASPHRILLDTDVDTDDIFALLYLLKLNRSEFDVKAVTVSANAWTNAGHAVNQLYDTLYMMGRDDIPLGVGGEGGILPNGTILPDVGGYLSIIEQGVSTAGGCRYRQAIPKGLGGRLDIDNNYGLRRELLPQGKRGYVPLEQPTAQQVMLETISAGPTTVLITGTHTNFAIFLMKYPHLKKNVEHIFVMGGGVRSENPTGCCPENAASSCTPRQCGDRGNMFTSYQSNPYAEFNVFGDPFAAYQVIHSGIPITLVPLDATNTIPINKDFFTAFENTQHTYEARYCFQSLKMARDTWFDDQFYTSYFMWDSFTAGVAASIMRNGYRNNGANEFADMQYINITVVTSNEPYGASDGSNPFFDGLAAPLFGLRKNGVHSGHVQTGNRDPFCRAKYGKGKCQDGYTKEIDGPDAVRVLVAIRAKPNRETNSSLDREFFKSFLEVLNTPQHSGLFNFTTQFSNYKQVFYQPNLTGQKLGKPVVFDMDMSAGDFLALICLLKVPVEKINLKAILVNGNGWANAATIDTVYDILHMMDRDDIPVGLGKVFAVGQPDPSFPAVGDCKYIKAIPHGGGGFLDSDTLYGFSRSLPRSPRRYTAQNSVQFGAPRDTDHPELRQPLALEVWGNISKSVGKGEKITILTNGPLTNLADILQYEKKSNSTIPIQEVYIVGGHVMVDKKGKGNVFTVPSNKYAEFNMFLDPLAAKAVLESNLDITLIPLTVQRQVSSFSKVIERLSTKKTPESMFAHQLLSRLHKLQQTHRIYHHMDIFLGEILGSILLANESHLNATTSLRPIDVVATGDVLRDGQLVIDKNTGRYVNVLDRIDPEAYYEQLSHLLGDKKLPAVVSSFNEQRSLWNTPTKT